MMTRTDLIEKLVTTLPAWPSPADHCSQPAPTEDGHREGWEKGPQDNQWHYSLIADHGGRVSVTREQWERALIEKLQRLEQPAQKDAPATHPRDIGKPFADSVVPRLGLDDALLELAKHLTVWPMPADDPDDLAALPETLEGWQWFEPGAGDGWLVRSRGYGVRDAIGYSEWRRMRQQLAESDWPETEQRLDHIGQNGGTGEHYPDSKASNPKDALGAGKLPLHLWPATATAHGSLALMDGALKYGRTNWRPAGVRASTYVSASMRHLNAWFEGEDMAPDSGLSHLAHALAGLAILIDAEDAGMMTDDRMIPGGYLNAIDKLTPEVARLMAKHADKHPHHYTIQDADH